MRGSIRGIKGRDDLHRSAVDLLRGWNRTGIGHPRRLLGYAIPCRLCLNRSGGEVRLPKPYSSLPSRKEQ